MGETVGGLSLAKFLNLLLMRLEDTLLTRLSNHLPQDWPTRPRLELLEQTPPDSHSHEYMTSLCRTLAATPTTSAHARLVRCYLTSSPISMEKPGGGRCPDTFMKSWKAILEQGYFGCVLVGQDIMRNFIEAFPNEFQVAEGK